MLPLFDTFAWWSEVRSSRHVYGNLVIHIVGSEYSSVNNLSSLCARYRFADLWFHPYHVDTAHPLPLCSATVQHSSMYFSRESIGADRKLPWLIELNFHTRCGFADLRTYERLSTFDVRYRFRERHCPVQIHASQLMMSNSREGSHT